MWIQKKIKLAAKRRGFHLITHELLAELTEIKQYRVGLVHIFIQHTSASLAINENADADVRVDLESYFSKIAPEDEPYFLHTMEGSDDMPAHIKSVMIGNDLTLPIADGRLALGTWQGIYLCEHRNYGGERKLIVTLQGD